MRVVAWCCSRVEDHGWPTGLHTGGPTQSTLLSSGTPRQRSTREPGNVGGDTNNLPGTGVLFAYLALK
ncbi:hypothetical protein Vlu01_11930 [Micromonospora lutea]|uniref:Uncharacterized protein n=1 Tax=Micromonospora lutea TaxID=419825 RepID=A0ABQ4IRN7_9ACTN|nr:hypothetical protein Vlu01_11930 [Micromonospora lutea]